MEVVKDDNISSDSLEPVPPSAAISLPTPNRITHHLSPECPTTVERTSATDQTMHTPATEPESAIKSCPKLAARFVPESVLIEQFTPEPEEEHWLIDLWTTEQVPTLEPFPPQSVSVNYLDAPVPSGILPTPLFPFSPLALSTSLDLPALLVPLSSCCWLPLTLPPVSLPPARPCEADSLQAHDATTAYQLHFGSFGFTVSPQAPCSSSSTLVPRHPESTADFRASGCTSALHPFDSTRLLLLSSFVLTPSTFALN